jgi:hypothetical protein
MCKFEWVTNAYQVSSEAFDEMDRHAYQKPCEPCQRKLQDPAFYYRLPARYIHPAPPHVH